MPAPDDLLPPPEFSRPVLPELLGRGEVRHRLSATPQECAALAARLELEDIRRLDASLTTRPVRHTLAGATTGERGKPVVVDGVAVGGKLEAEVVQRCVVTLEPFTSTLEAEVEALFVPEAAVAAFEAAIDLDPGEEGEAVWPEPYGPAGIDLGELVAQTLSLALDPFPRSPAAPVDASHIEPDSDDAIEVSPFAKLKRLREEDGG